MGMERAPDCGWGACSVVTALWAVRVGAARARRNGALIACCSLAVPRLGLLLFGISWQSHASRWTAAASVSGGANRPGFVLSPAGRAAVASASASGCRHQKLMGFSH